MGTSFRRRSAFAVTVILSALLAVSPVHAAVALTVESTVPTDGARLQPGALTAVEIEYNLPLDTDASVLTLTNKNGLPVSGTRSFASSGDALQDNDTIVFTPSSTLPAAGSPFTASWTVEASGGLDSDSGSLTFTLDDTPPAAPAITDATDPVNSHNDDDFSAEGTAEPDATVDVSVSDGIDSVSGDAIADAAGDWALTGLDVTSLDDGTLDITATATDDAGNTSDSSTAFQVVKETTVPAAPTVDSATDPVNAGNETTFSATGDATEGATVEVTVTDGTDSVSGETTAGTPWTLTGLDVSTLDDGELDVTAAAIDSHGNTSADSAPLTVTKDTAAPTAPAISSATDPVNDGNQAAVEVKGTAEPGAVIEVTADDGSSTVDDTTTAAGDGTWTLTDFDVSTLADGTLTITATATDAAGNTSAPSAGTDVTKDTAAPDTPTVVITDPVNADNEDAVVAQGDAEDGSSVEITVTDGDEGSVSKTTTADDGWSTTLDLSSLADGTLDVEVTATDDADNVSVGHTQQITKDTVAPAAPTISIDDDPITSANQAAVGISGTAEPAATVSVSVDDDGDSSTAAITTSTTADSGGGWTVTVDLSPLEQGTITATATVTDPAGNTGPSANDTAVKDLGSPGLVSTAPADGATVQSPSEVTATYDEPLDTEASSITVEDNTGTPIAGSTTFRDGDRTIVFTPASLPEVGGPYDVTVDADDGQGNDPATTEFSFAVDNTDPDAPTITSVTDPVNAANETSVEVTGDAEDGATVDVTVSDGTTSETGQTTSDGTWSLTIDVSSLADGTLTVTATATDAAGNTSTASETTQVDKDTGAPAAPTITSATDPVTSDNETAVEITGDAENGATVDVTISDGTTSESGQTTSDGTWSLTIDVSSLADGTLTVTATASDAAGNTSPVSEAREVTKRFGLRWQLTNRSFVPRLDVDFVFGQPGDHMLMCDSDGNGTASATIVRDRVWTMSAANSEDASSVVFAYGRPGDLPVCGDWDGNGTQTPGIRRNNVFYLSNRIGGGAADIVLGYGKNTDTPVVGDFDGDGVDTFGVRRGNAYYLRNSNTTGIADLSFGYGKATDAPIVGDWDGNGTDTPGVRRGTQFLLRNVNSSGPAQRSYDFGPAEARPVAGDFDGNGIHTVGVVFTD